MSPATACLTSLRVLALDLEQVADLGGLLLVAQVILRVAADGALEHADPRQLADERVGGDLERLGDQRLGRIGLDGISSASAALPLRTGGPGDRPG